MAEELKRERERSELNLEELTNLLDGGKTHTEKRRKIIKIVVDNPVFHEVDELHDEPLDVAAKKSAKLIQIARTIQDIDERWDFIKSFLDHHIKILISQHCSLFIPTIEVQGTDEQKAKWLKLALDYDIIGAYAQTELGHGTFVRGMETTAEFDPSTQEFILNSPTLTSIKWWPGLLGCVATHAIVIARLITKGHDHGMHLFIVQIRSLEDHHPLPGIKVGDIGPKFGFNFNDNGFLHLTNVRIPRDHMLMKHSQVLPDGTYFKPPTDKVTYGSLVYCRVIVFDTSAKLLAQAVTIAIRYSVVRRQTINRPGEPETQVLDYQTQQYKLFPLLASAYAMKLTCHHIWKLYDEVSREVSKGNIESLQELHATTAGLKAFSTKLSADGIEFCRLCCGGHGYSIASGLPLLYVNFTGLQTAEGENTVMLLQTGRYLFKMFTQKVPQTQLPANVNYLASDYIKLRECPVSSSHHFSDPHILIETYRHRSRKLVEVALSRYQEEKRKGFDSISSWNYSSVDWMMAARAHCHYIVMKMFHLSINEANLCQHNLEILQALHVVFGLHGIVENYGEFSLDNYINSVQLSMARNQLYHFLSVIRYEAVPLVDAFDFHDVILNSCLGRYDGDVYRHMYEWALKAPRNKSQVHETYEKYLKSLLTKTKAKL